MLRAAALVTLLAAPAHAGGYVAIVPDLVPIAAPAAPSGVPPELLVAYVMMTVATVLSSSGMLHFIVPTVAALRAHPTQVTVHDGWYTLSNDIAARLAGREGYAPVEVEGP